MTRRETTVKRVVVVGGGTMGSDVAVVFLRGGCAVDVVEPHVPRRAALPAHVQTELAAIGRESLLPKLQTAETLDAVSWPSVDLVVECIPEQLPLKQGLFAELVDRTAEHTVLASNSSSFPISAIGRGLDGQHRMLGLHFFMPAHLVPLVEVVLGPQTKTAVADDIMACMRGCGSVPVQVCKDKPGFLANRLQHALAREAFALLDEGVASAQDIDAAVRFGFGFRFLAAGPIMQRDHAGLDVHCAAAATMYPSLAANTEPGRILRDHVVQGHLGMKAGRGFFEWTLESAQAERARYATLLRQGLNLLQAELPPLPALSTTEG